MTPDEIVAKFSAALDNFEPITDQPSDSDLTRLREAIAPLLLHIPYDKTGGTHNLDSASETPLASPALAISPLAS